MSSGNHTVHLGVKEQQLKILEDLERQKRQYSNSTFASASSSNFSSNSASIFDGIKIEGTNHIFPSYQEGSKSDFREVKDLFGTGLKDTTTTYDVKNQKILDKKTFDETIKNTFSYFIYQDSNHGNTLLPVIPRISLPVEKIEQTECLVNEPNPIVSQDPNPLIIEID